MRRPQPNWTALRDARLHLIALGLAPSDAENDLALIIRERKVPCRARHVMITTFAGQIVHPHSRAIQALKRQGQWGLSPPVDLGGDDLDFENNSCRKPWRYPGFFAHVSGIEFWAEGLRRVFRLETTDVPQEPIARASEPATAAERKATSAEIRRAIKALAAKLKIDPLFRPKDAKQLISDLSLPLGPHQFRMAWREARRQTKLPLQARAGRPKRQRRFKPKRIRVTLLRRGLRKARRTRLAELSLISLNTRRMAPPRHDGK
jgi:hypothetical protein